LSRRQLKLSVSSIIRDYEPVCALERFVPLHTHVIRIQMLSLCLLASLKLLTQKSFEKKKAYLKPILTQLNKAGIIREKR
jgi:hypothetical protein